MLRSTHQLSAALVLLLLTGCGRGQQGVESAPMPADVPTYEQTANGGVLGEPTAGQRINPGDLLDVVVFDAPEISREVRVTEQGQISLPLLGAVAAAGLTAGELERSLVERLRGRYMVDPQVSVGVTEVRRDPIYVTGEVNRPGAFPIQPGGSMTVLQAVTLGEGLAPMAASRAMIIRTAPGGAKTRIPVNIGGMLAGRDPDVPLQPNDIVFVPRNTGKSVVSGFFGALLRVVTFRGIF